MKQQSQHQVSMSQQNKASTFLIVVYGLPASGKSTFSDWLSKQFFTDALLISGDGIEKLIKQNKNYAHHLSSMPVQQLIIELKNIKSDRFNAKPQFNPQNWKESRKLIEEIVSRAIQKQSIILDDDFLLRSQRKVFRKISWKHQINYLQIFIDTSVKDCLQNLKKRTSINNDCVITQETVVKAAQKLQNDNQNQYGMRLSMKERKQISKQDLTNKFKIVEIHPNDPNDPEHHQVKAKHDHTTQQLLQLQVRAFINSVIKLPQQQFESVYGKKIENKKQLGNLMNQWKKIYTKSQNRSIDIEIINKSFIDYLQNTSIKME